MKLKLKTGPYFASVELPAPHEMRKNNIVAVDPGIGGTGVAVWKKGALRPAFTAVLNAPRKLAWWQKALFIADEIRGIGETYAARIAVCECPQFFQSAGGEMVAGRGDLVKLAIAVGCIAGKVEEGALLCDFYPVEVNTWKGQLSKENVIRRIVRTLGAEDAKFSPEQYKSHAWDAVGLGLFVRGNFQ